MKIDASTTIKEIISEAPDSSRILANFGIPVQTHANRPLHLVCQDLGLSFHEVVHSLEAGVPPPQDDESTNWQDASPSRLISHIVEKHHTFCREEVARIEQLLETVVHTHAARHPELRRIHSLFLKMGADLKQHLLKEEQTLFPMIVRMEEASNRNTAIPRFPFGTIANPIRMMIMEHDTGDQEIEEIRTLTADYAHPDDAGADYLALLEGLQRFENDMKEHVFLENERLFPRAIAIEQQGAAGRSASP